MNFSDYVELQVTSNFSFLRGASHPEELVKTAASLGYQAIAITDLHTVSGVVRAFEAARESSIALIVGTALELSEDGDWKGQDFREMGVLPQSRLPFRIYLYPTSLTSYGNMCALLTKGKMRAPKGSCFLTLEDLVEGTEGLLAVVELDGLELSSSSVEIHPPDVLKKNGERFLPILREIFNEDRLSLSFRRSYRPYEEEIILRTAQLANTYRIPLLATNDVCYHVPERHKLQDILTCIRHGVTLEEAGYKLFANRERHLKSHKEVKRIFARYPQALERSLEIASRASNFSLSQLKYEYPREICPDGREPIDYLVEITWHRARDRYPRDCYPGGVPEKVQAQLEHELRLVQELGYAKYFLTVYDIVEFARSRQILAQGRGAAANSAICYVLGITSVDPDRFNLLFERFVSRERDEPPDIDIDFEHERREEVIQYIYNKFGRMRAALVSEVISYRTRSAVREVGKVFGLSEDMVKVLSKTIRRSQAGRPTAEELKAVGLEPEAIAIHQTIDYAQVIKGFPRHLSQHVGGFIVSESELCRIVPIENASMPGRTVIEWDKDDIETMGMLKIDILALGMLTCIRKALDLVNTKGVNTKGVNTKGLDTKGLDTKGLDTEGVKGLALYNVPPEDPAVYRMLSRADSVGVFQVESRAQMSMLPRLRPKTFYDLVVEVAIVRPGPIVGGMVHPYLRRRNGQEPVIYPSEAVKLVLESTLGVPIFQEQVMQLAMVAAGFSGGEADMLRRAMSGWRKKSGLLDEYGKRIVSGMLERGYAEDFAQRVSEQIHGFGEYGFPQSHAASFALLVYISAWLKLHYPAEFAAAILNSQPMGFYQPAQLIDDARKHGVKVEPMDVKHSEWDCTLEKGFGAETSERATVSLRLGLRLISGLRKTEVEKLVQARRNRQFSSIKDLWLRSGVRVPTLRRLALADAFVSLSSSRSEGRSFESEDSEVSRSNLGKSNRGLSRQAALWEISRYRDGSLPLFEHLEEPSEDVILPVLSDRQVVLADYEHTGFSLKAHPLSFLRKSLSDIGVSPAENLRNQHDFPMHKKVRVAGLVLVRQRPGTANGVAFVTLEDETGFANLIIPSHIFQLNHATICDSATLLIEGQIERQGEVVYVKVDWAKDLSPALYGLAPISRDFH